MVAAVFFQLAAILIAARVCGSLARRAGQPRVCGEIAAGLALGPSLVGALFPQALATMFPADAGPGLRMMSELGLVFLMLLVGLDLHVDELRRRKRAACAISVAGIVVPFALGLALAGVLHPALAPDRDPIAFALFLGTAISITAIPTLARILDELHLQRTRIATLTTTAAALDDVVGWTLLAAVTALVQARFEPLEALVRLGAAALFAAMVVKGGRKLVQRRCERVEDPAMFRSGTVLTLAVVAALSGAAVTDALGLSGIFGAFTVGIALGGDPRLRDAIVERLQPLVLTLFLPIFFTYTGLRTDAGALHGAWVWALCALVVVVAVAGKVGGCALAAMTQKLSRSDALSIGVLMNTRGLMELVVINVGLDLGIIPHSVFFMLVVMAIVTTYMTAPLVRRILRDSEMAPGFTGTYAGQPWPAAQRQAGVG
jgi:Kef-type K+ transport system membrane component KefB